jgi:hypothetical protein
MASRVFDKKTLSAPISAAKSSMGSRAPKSVNDDTQVVPSCTTSGPSPAMAAVVILVQALDQSSTETVTLKVGFSVRNRDRRLSMSCSGLGVFGITQTLSSPPAGLAALVAELSAPASLF